MSRKVVGRRGQAHTGLIVAGVSLIILLGLLILRPAAQPTTAKLLQEAVKQLDKSDNYPLIIKETAPDYNLVFQGIVEEGVNLKGNILEFGLDVLLEKGELYVRSIGTEEWQSAETLELQGLSGFLTNPADLLHSQVKNFRHAVAGQDISLSDELCQTVYLDLVDSDAFILQLFPDINLETVQRVSLGVAMAEPDLLFRQARLLVEFKDGGGSLERVYYLGQ